MIVIREKRKKAGFTLIELMMAIAIISLLASVVFASLQGARIKARNAARNSQILEYAKALALYESENGHYPIPEPYSGVYCLGTYLNDQCGWLPSNGPSDELKNALHKYLPSFPPVDNQIIKFGLNDFVGATYTCDITDSYTDAGCPSAQIDWALEGTNAICVKPQNAKTMTQTPHPQNVECSVRF